MERDADAALYVISVAAELAGVHPQTLRLYERKGLLDPARSMGGNRRYSERDLARLRRIGELTSAGVNLVGVRLVLDLEKQVDDLRSELGQDGRDQPGRGGPPPGPTKPARRRRRDSSAHLGRETNPMRGGAPSRRPNEPEV